MEDRVLRPEVARRGRSVFLAAAAGLLLVGLACSLGPKEDPSRFYVLTSLPEGEADETVALDGVTVGVGPVLFPDYLERNEFVSRVSPNEVNLHDFDRWAEPVDTGFKRVLSRNLSQLLEPARVVEHPWFSSTPVDYAVEVKVVRFERDSTGAGELRCRWALVSVASASGGVVAERLDGGDARYVEPSGSDDVEATVAAMSRAVGELSGDVAAAVVRVVGER